jgi:hypothetical protein
MRIDKRVAIAVLASSLLSSCATVVSTPRQMVTIDSVPQGAKIYTGVRKSRKGTTEIRNRRELGHTPMKVSVIRKDGVVQLEKDGYVSTEVPLHREGNPMILGNIITGGLVGCSIDGSTGAANRYDPDQYLVELQPVTPEAAAPASSEAVEPTSSEIR